MGWKKEGIKTRKRERMGCDAMGRKKEGRGKGPCFPSIWNSFQALLRTQHLQMEGRDGRKEGKEGKEGLAEGRKEGIEGRTKEQKKKGRKEGRKEGR